MAGATEQTPRHSHFSRKNIPSFVASPMPILRCFWITSNTVVDPMTWQGPDLQTLMRNFARGFVLNIV